MALSKLTPHPCTDVSLEQYATEGDLAAYWMLTLTTGEIVCEVREGCGKGLFDM